MPDARPRFRDGLWMALPIVLGYLPIAFSFGVAATKAGLTQPEAVMLSVVIYAGASQFLALALVTGGAPVGVAVLTLVAMNARHVVYGPALMKRAGAPLTRAAGVWAWGLTDEVFGAALGHLARGGGFSERMMFGLGFAAYAAWIAGTALGAVAGGGALAAWPVLDAALGFMLPALFLALLLSIVSRAALWVMAVAGAVTAAGIVAGQGTAGLLAGMIAGALTGTLTGVSRR